MWIELGILIFVLVLYLYYNCLIQSIEKICFAYYINYYLILIEHISL